MKMPRMTHDAREVKLIHSGIQKFIDNGEVRDDRLIHIVYLGSYVKIGPEFASVGLAHRWLEDQ